MRTWLRIGIGAALVWAVASTWVSGQAVQTAPIAGQAPASQAATAQTPAAPPLPTSRADLKPTETDDRLIAAPPAFEVGADGTSKLTFTTLVPTPACRVYLGTLNANTTLDTSFYPTSIREALAAGATATAHTITVDLKSLNAWLPAGPADAAREGDAYVRIEVFDPRTSAPRYFERRVHYALAGGKYEARPTILFGPALDLVTTSSATVSWDLERPALGKVEVWSSDGASKLGEFSQGNDPATRHIVKVTGLRPRQTYKYRVLVRDRADGPVLHTGRFYAFRAAPVGGGTFSFAYLSDGRPSAGGGFNSFNGVNAEVTPRLMADGYRRGAEFAMFGGDLISGATSNLEHHGMMLDTWRLLNDPVAHVMPIYEGIGNHEILYDYFVDAQNTRYGTSRMGAHGTEAEFARRFVNPANAPEPEVQNGVTGPPYLGIVYSFDYGNSHFVMLNTTYWYTTGGPTSDRALGLKLLGGNRNGYVMANQLAWLDKDLAAARQRGVRHIFVVGHEAPFPSGGHVADSMWWNGLNDKTLPSGDVVDMRSRFLTILNRHRVTAIMAGHEHNYARVVAGPDVDKALTRPLTQFVSGGAGAPFYAQDEKAPWSANIRKFAATYHYVLFTIAGDAVRFEAIDLDGRVIDSGVLR
jgi:3',5'-cyclic-AMP phosphodiesterase